MKLRTRTNQPVEGDELDNLTLSGDLEVAEGSEVKVFENIVDKDGHKRFIEGDITLEEISGITPIYAKWSLSGSHLMIVIAFSVANATALSYGRLCYVNLPDWIKDKIYQVSGNYVARYMCDLFDSDLGTQSLGTYLLKSTLSGSVWIDYSNLTLTKDRIGRIQFDLLIDNE